MPTGRSSKLWMVNVMSFILFFILCGTGLLNWLVLPRGYEARGSFLVPYSRNPVKKNKKIMLLSSSVAQ